MNDEELYEIGVKAYGNELRKNERKGYGPYVTAVISAIRPIIERETRERCAKVAEADWYPNEGKIIAKAIRGDGND